jgi:hypothetical protein
MIGYAQARQYIEDGDLIAVRGRNGLLAHLTRLLSRSPVTHTGIALWMGEALWMVELNSGKNHAIPVSQLDGMPFDVYDPPVPDRAAIRAATIAALRSKISYAFIALPVIGLLNLMQVKVLLHARRLLVCSGYCVLIYEVAGWPERTRILSPAELVAQLHLKLEVRPDPELQRVGEVAP